MTLVPSAESFTAILERVAGSSVHDLRLETRRLRDGLESDCVLAITARFRDDAARLRLIHLVAKQFTGPSEREVTVYENLVAPHVGDVAPRVLGVDTRRDGGVLFLEALRATRAWPWSDTAHASEVLRCVARLHLLPRSVIALPAWDYDGELARSAAHTLELLETTRRTTALADTARSLPALRRIARDVGPLRRRLLDGPLPQAILHGDLHSRNVVIRARCAPGAPRVALLDWQRARIGSPLEDVR